MAHGGDVLRLPGIVHPIIQAPMAGESTPALTAAVSNAGALGYIGIGARNAQHAQTLFRQTRALATGSINGNVFCRRAAIDDSRSPQRG